MMMLVVGQLSDLYGNVTQLKAIGAKAPHNVEDMLGYHSGRLARGYWICLLTGQLGPGDFELAGTTLRSGGKMGAPELTQSKEQTRTRVHDAVLNEYGAASYRDLQDYGLACVTASGTNRLAKVVPVTPHTRYGSPAKQYPMGGGSLQWELKPPGKPFFIAAFVDALGVAETPTFRTPIGAKARYDDRARLYRYLESAP